MKRFSAFILITLFYVVAFGLAFVFAYFMKDVFDNAITSEKPIAMFINLFLSMSIATIVMFIFSLIINNVSTYDAFWSVHPIFLIVFYYILYGNFHLSHLIILLPLAAWAIRLTLNWAFEFEDIKWEDWRYRDIKEKIKNPILKQAVVFIGMMFIPTVCVYFGVLPILTSFSTLLEYGPLTYIMFSIGGAIVIFGTIFQGISDHQMKKYRQLKTGKPIDVGLWKYSRHPNYFGEICVWFGVFVASTSSVIWYLDIWGIILMVALFLFISCPLAEKRYLARYGEDYQHYIDTTSILVPFPKRKSKVVND